MLGTEIVAIAFKILIPLKTFFFDVGFYGYIMRYYKTYGTFN